MLRGAHCGWEDEDVHLGGGGEGVPGRCWTASGRRIIVGGGDEIRANAVITGRWRWGALRLVRKHGGLSGRRRRWGRGGAGGPS